MIILRYLKPLSPSSRIVLLFDRLKKRCSTGLPREFRILSGVFLLLSTWSLFRFTWLNSVLLFVFFRPCKEFSPSRLLLSHLGLLSIEGLMVKQYCYSVCAFLKGFCQTGIRGVFVVTSAFKSFILKLDMGKSIFLNIFVQDWRYVQWLYIAFNLLTKSQSKLLGHLTVFLPSQCWCATFGELTAMNNIGRTRRRARSKQTALGGSVPTIFVWDYTLLPWLDAFVTYLSFFYRVIHCIHSRTRACLHWIPRPADSLKLWRNLITCLREHRIQFMCFTWKRNKQTHMKS